MSFSNNVRPDRMPGPIAGNPANGLCEKVCIEVKKVFDACIKQETLTDQVITLSGTTPADVQQPFTFVGARSSSSVGTIGDLVVTPTSETPGCSRVQCSVEIPLSVSFTDANGTSAVGTSSLTIQRDVLLRVPEPSVIPYEIVAVVNAVSAEGSYLSDGQFSITLCVTVILKVVMDVELLVPSYGYCYIPPCQEYQEEICDGFFDLPLFPR
ncbi:MAG: hypothetical protein IJT69_00780 [Clostridia bacterium]|nr:hypothetical protein [Clostridia bacterium]